MKALIMHVVGQDDAIKLLITIKIIVGMKYRQGYLVARYGVNKAALKHHSQVLDGIK